MERPEQLEQMQIQDRQQKIINNMSLIHYTIQRLEVQLPAGMSKEDAVQCGCIGLIEAIDLFEEKKGKFGAFAYIKIRGAIMDGIFQYRWMNRNQVRDGQKWKKAREELEMRTGRLATEKEVAMALKLKPETGAVWQRLANMSILYSDGLAFSDTYMFRESAAALETDEERVEERDEVESLWRSIRNLDPMEEQLIIEYYFHHKSLKTFAKEQQISHNWACALHRRALKKLRKRMKS